MGFYPLELLLKLLLVAIEVLMFVDKRKREKALIERLEKYDQRLNQLEDKLKKLL